MHGFLPDLDLHHAACDVAVVQGGLSTTMELTAAGRPFLYFPLGHHFEQQVHVRHRLERHRAGRAMDYREADPGLIADELAAALKSPTDYLPVPTDGAAKRSGPGARPDLIACLSAGFRDGSLALPSSTDDGWLAAAARPGVRPGSRRGREQVGAAEQQVARPPR